MCHAVNAEAPFQCVVLRTSPGRRSSRNRTTERSLGGWTPGALVSPRRLGHREAIQRLCAEFDEDGPDCGYNAVIQDYASIWWKQANSDPNLTRFPDHHRQLAARLKRMTGRTHSTKA